jgi:hypothetical protein
MCHPLGVGSCHDSCIYAKQNCVDDTNTRHKHATQTRDTNTRHKHATQTHDADPDANPDADPDAAR